MLNILVSVIATFMKYFRRISVLIITENIIICFIEHELKNILHHEFVYKMFLSHQLDLARPLVVKIVNLSQWYSIGKYDSRSV